MAVYVVDGSALVKRYIREIGSTWVLKLFDSELSEVFVSAITSVEIIAAIARRSRSGSIKAADAQQLVTNLEATCSATIKSLKSQRKLLKRQ